LSLTFGFSDEWHNPALKYAPNGKKIGLPAKSVSDGAAAAAAATKLSSAAASSYPPPDIALCRIFRAQEQSNFAQVHAATSCPSMCQVLSSAAAGSEGRHDGRCFQQVGDVY
jgi:hypothetical protein